jgi:hypothetical protein
MRIPKEIQEWRKLVGLKPLSPGHLQEQYPHLIGDDHDLAAESDENAQTSMSNKRKVGNALGGSSVKKRRLGIP